MIYNSLIWIRLGSELCYPVRRIRIRERITRDSNRVILYFHH